MNVQPFHDKVLVQRVTVPEVSRGGIIIPEVARDRPIEGRVVAVGPGRWHDGKLEPCSAFPGDHVLFGKFAGLEVTVAGVDLLLLRDDELLAKVIPEQP